MIQLNFRFMYATVTVFDHLFLTITLLFDHGQEWSSNGGVTFKGKGERPKTVINDRSR
jgi:hypothetical protein